MSLRIEVTNHAVERWKERVGFEKSAKEIAKLIRCNPYRTLGETRDGRLIINARGYILIVERTNTKMAVYTVYGTEEEFKGKREASEEERKVLAIKRWNKAIRERVRRRGKGVLG